MKCRFCNKSIDYFMIDKKTGAYFIEVILNGKETTTIGCYNCFLKYNGKDITKIIFSNHIDSYPELK